MFVVLNPNYVSGESKDEIVFCIKATSKVGRYQNDPEQMDGCVYYEARQLAWFPQATAVQPDNPLPLTRLALVKHLRERIGIGSRDRCLKIFMVGSSPANKEVSDPQAESTAGFACDDRRKM